MERPKRLIGLSRDLIIHPGETLAEVLEDRNISINNIASQTNRTTKFINEVINGSRDISPSFASQLQKALNIDKDFWVNLQSIYDNEIEEFNIENNISNQELDILKKLSEIINYYIQYNFIQSSIKPLIILDLREILGVNNLLDIPKKPLIINSAFRMSSANIDSYVLYSWQVLCELLTQNIIVKNTVDQKKLIKKIPEIKKVMFEKTNTIEKKLQEIFAECGIAFRIVPNFKGAPVQGYIKKRDNGSVILCLTLRNKFQDIFWFSLFHEIAHILNNDFDDQLIDFNSFKNENEIKADIDAQDFLINPNDYNEFILKNDFSINNIHNFAQSQGVLNCIVSGRLMKEKRISWESQSRPKYNWL